MLVALLLPRLLNDLPDRALMLTGGGVVAAGLAATSALLLAEPGQLTGWVMLALVWTALGAGTSMINTPSARLLRYQSDPEERASVFTAQFSLSHACFLLTYPLAGWGGNLAGHAGTASALTILATLATVTAARTWPATTPVTVAT